MSSNHTPSTSSLTETINSFKFEPESKEVLHVPVKSEDEIPAGDATTVDSSTQTCDTLQMITSRLHSITKNISLESTSNSNPSPSQNGSKRSSGMPDSVTTIENTIEHVGNMFPKINRMDVYDALLRSHWNVQKAREKLKRTMERNNKRKRRGGGDDSPPRKKVYKRIIINSRTNKPTSVKCYPKPKVVVPVEESSDDEYCLSKWKRQKTFDFLCSARIHELTMANGLTAKKAEIIIGQRPFKNFKHLCEKLEKVNFNISTLCNSVAEFLRLQTGVTTLMKSCSVLSQSMAYKLRQLTSAQGSSQLKLQEQPKSLSQGLHLAGYQMVGLNWLRLLHEQAVNGILADEMGLGKTVQVIAFLAYLKEEKLCTTGVHLIVVPSSTLENWCNEMSRWCPSLTVESYYGSQEDRKAFRCWWRNDKNKKEVANVDVLITTYNIINSTRDDKYFFRKMSVQYVVYDEAHMLKNITSQRYISLMRIDANHRILLTGTPLQNNLVELMSLLIFVMPHMFAEKQADLIKMFRNNKKSLDVDKKGTWERQRIQQAKEIMEPFVLRRLKENVLQDLPVKTEQIISCTMTPMQKARYAELLREFNEHADDEDPDDETESTTASGSFTGSMGIMMLLRRAAIHPLLIRYQYTDNTLQTMAKKLKSDPAYREEHDKNILYDLQEMTDHQLHKMCQKYKSIEKFKLDESLIMNGAKIQELEKLLPQLKSENHRVLFFSQFRQALDLVESYLVLQGYSFIRLDGQTPVVERQDLVDQFNTDDSIFIFLLSTRAGGFGINLASADTVIIHDIDMNPYNDKQAEDRCHRVGQTRPVTVMKLITSNTIEEAMLKLANNKLSLEQEITQGESKHVEKTLMVLLKEVLKSHTDTAVEAEPKDDGTEAS